MSYTDSIQIVWRAGTSTDPYVTYTNESKPIINNIAVLSEIPDIQNRVLIDGYNETSSQLPASNQFCVNYDNGTLTFNPSEEGKQVLATYKGRGVIQYPAERIFAHNKAGGTQDIVQNLQDIVDNSQSTLQQAKVELQTVNDASTSTKKIWETPVQHYSDIATTFPNPSIGTTVQVIDNGNTYRWDGTNWQNIETVNTTTYSASRVKTIIFVLSDNVMQGVYNGAIIRFPFSGSITDIYASCGTAGNTKSTIKIESCPDNIFDTAQELWTDIFSTDLTIDANKKSNSNATTPFVLSNTVVNKNDHFRVNAAVVGNGLKDLTIEVMVQV